MRSADGQPGFQALAHDEDPKRVGHRRSGSFTEVIVLTVASALIVGVLALFLT